MLMILVLLPSAVVGVGRGVAGRIKIVLGFFCGVCLTCLSECWLGCRYNRAYGTVWWIAMGGGFILFVP